MIPEFLYGEFIVTEIEFGGDRYCLLRYFMFKDNPDEYLDCSMANLLPDPTYEDKLESLMIEARVCLDMSICMN